MLTPGLVGGAPPARLGRRAGPQPAGHRLRGNPRNHQRGLDAHPGSAAVPGHRQRPLRPPGRPGYEATRQVVQTKLWPANLRLLDPALAADSAGLDGTQSVLIVAFESAELSQRPQLEQALASPRPVADVPDDEVLIDDAGQATGRSGAGVPGATPSFRAAGPDGRARPDRRHVRDRDHLGSLARLRRRGTEATPRCSRRCAAAARSTAGSPTSTGRPGALLHLRRRLPPGRGPGRGAGRDQGRGIRRGDGCRRHHHPITPWAGSTGPGTTSSGRSRSPWP